MRSRKTSSTATVFCRLFTTGLGVSSSIGGGFLGYLADVYGHIDVPERRTKAKTLACIASGAAICTATVFAPVFVIRSMWRRAAPPGVSNTVRNSVSECKPGKF